MCSGQNLKDGIIHQWTAPFRVYLHLCLIMLTYFNLHTGLLPYERVSIAIAAKNSKGEGPFSPEVIYRTAEACKLMKAIIGIIPLVC